MSLLSVYVEGAKDPSVLGVRRLAALIAARYGLSAADLEKRIASGRFRVKANIDEATARAFVDDLEKLGARCVVVEMPARTGEAARTAMPGLGAMGSAGPGAQPRPPTASEPALDPSFELPSAPRPISSAAVQPPGAATPATSPPPTPRPPTPAAIRTISSASVPPPTSAAALLANAAAERSHNLEILDPPTLRGLASSERVRTPANSQPPLPAASRTATLPLSGLPPRPAASPTPAPSGLGAARSDAGYPAGSGTGLGALDGASFSLSTLDGHDDSPAVPMYEDPPLRRAAAARATHDEPMASLAAMEALTPVETSPSRATAPASSAPLPPRGPARPDDIPSVSPHLGVQAPFSIPAASMPHSPRPSHVPGAGLFAPPMSEPIQLELADDRPRRASLALGPPESAPMMFPAVATPRPAGSGASVVAATELRTRRRTAFALGVFLSVVLGFVPAHLLAQARERAAFERIDNRVRIAQSEIASIAEWEALDDIRTALLRQKRAAHHEIIIASMALWVALAGSLSFAWARFGLRRFDPSELDDGDR